VLIDSGNTYNFLDTAIAGKLGYRIDKIASLNVEFADG